MGVRYSLSANIRRSVYLLQVIRPAGSYSGFGPNTPTPSSVPTRTPRSNCRKAMGGSVLLLQLGHEDIFSIEIRHRALVVPVGSRSIGPGCLRTHVAWRGCRDHGQYRLKAPTLGERPTDIKRILAIWRSFYLYSATGPSSLSRP